MAKFKLILLVSIFLFSFTPVLLANNKSKSFVVVIDPGHGAHDPGTIGTKLKVKEKNVNLAVALLLGEYIHDNHPDVKVIYTRKTDVFIPLNDRADIANKAKADLFISIHANAVKNNNKPYGTETYTMGMSSSNENLEVAKQENSVIYLEDNYKQTYEGFDPNSAESYIIFEFMQNQYMEQSIEFAASIQKEFTNGARRYNRGVRQAGLLVLRRTSMPSVLVELGFLSNNAEEEFLNSREGQSKMAHSICNAFTHYKKEHDRKIGTAHPSKESKESKESNNENIAEETTTPVVTEAVVEKTDRTIEKNGTVVYKIQILAADRKLPAKSSLLKGYKADYFKEKGLYKYTYGESSDWNKISQIRKSLLKDFKDAFIISFKNGIKMPNK